MAPRGFSARTRWPPVRPHARLARLQLARALQDSGLHGDLLLAAGEAEAGARLPSRSGRLSSDSPTLAAVMRRRHDCVLVPTLAVALLASLAACDPPACDKFGPRVDCGEREGVAETRSEGRPPLPGSGSCCRRRRQTTLAHSTSCSPPPRSGYVGITPAQCESKGCCWAPSEFEGAPHVDLPWCFTANAAPAAYRVAELREGAGALLPAQP